MKKSLPARNSKKSGRRAADPAQEPQVSVSPPEQASFPIVGVGASAGALEAYTQLLKALPPNPGMAFVLIPHLDPTHESALTELLSHSTQLPVVQVSEGMVVRPDRVYVLPPNCEMSISDRILYLKRRDASRTPHMVIDIFFRSLAEDQGTNAVGVILSGTASDGTLGVMAIKGEGGITFAQDSKSARYDGMPNSATSSGCIDFVLPPERIADELIRLRKHPYVAQPKDAEIENLGEERASQLNRVFRLLREARRVDFSEYKSGTIRRRILRRMALKQFNELGEYVRYLQQHREEVQALYQDLLINVTCFFRNPEAFDSLKEKVYPGLLKDHPSGDPIRIWVPGCSTGEEAYSHAIALTEYLGEVRADFSIQVFGTDLSAEAIECARAGIYKESIRSDVTPTRLRRFFTLVEGGYQINKAIRNMCVFAVQNVFRDPPFSRMDIVSCRNVLIYMSSALQRRIIPILHYALKPNGFLMVGNTEGLLGVGSELFELADKKNKIYLKRAIPSPVQFGYVVEPYEGVTRKAEAAAVAKDPESFKAPYELQREADRLLLSKYVPAAVVVNERLDILQTRGHTNRYLELPSGKATLNLLKMARQGLMFELQAAIKDARSKDAPVRRGNIQIDSHDSVDLVVTPFRAPLSQTRNYLIIFEDARPETAVTHGRTRTQQQAEPLKPDQRDAQIDQLKREIVATKEYLQSIIEAQEASNEELQSANEEIQSGNEELQSTNEELQTSKEELESANEELSTVNEEMQHRNLQLTQTTNDLTNLITSVNIPMVMLGPDLSVRRFTPQAESVFGFSPDDVGRPITNLKLKVDIADLETLLLNVIHEVKATQQEIQDQNGNWHRLRITPYRTGDNRIEGAVLALVDINDLKHSYDELATERANLDEALRQMPCGLMLAEAPSGKLVRTNARLEEMLGRAFSPGEKVADFAAFARYPNGVQSIEKWPLVKAMGGNVITDQEVEWVRSDGTHVFLLVSAAPMRSKTGEIVGVMATFFDLTFRHSAEEMLRVSEQMAASGRMAAALAHEINNPLEVLTNACYLLDQDRAVPDSTRNVISMAQSELRRIAHISQNLLGLYRRTSASERFSVQEVLEEVASLFEARLGAKAIRVVKRYDYDGEMVGSSAELRQIFLNLIGNAIEAMDSNGSLTLHISPSRNWKNFSSRGVRVSVADNGPGIARENRPRVFEPFFTTKAEKGTGLGLWVSRGIALKNGGDIRLRTSTAKGKSGAYFSVFLPAKILRRRSKGAGEIGTERSAAQRAGDGEK